MRPVDADELIRRIVLKQKEFDRHREEDWFSGLILAEFMVDEMPTLSLVKKGKWLLPTDVKKQKENKWVCSECKHISAGKKNFCHFCGADMR